MVDVTDVVNVEDTIDCGCYKLHLLWMLQTPLIVDVTDTIDCGCYRHC